MLDVDNYLASCGNSSIKLLVKLYAECDKIGGTESHLVVDEMNAMSSRRLDACTTASFSVYRTAYVKLNNSLQRNLRSDDDN